MFRYLISKCHCLFTGRDVSIVQPHRKPISKERRTATNVYSKSSTTSKFFSEITLYLEKYVHMYLRYNGTELLLLHSKVKFYTGSGARSSSKISLLQMFAIGHILGSLISIETTSVAVTPTFCTGHSVTVITVYSEIFPLQLL